MNCTEQRDEAQQLPVFGAADAFLADRAMSQQIQELEPLFQPLEALFGIIWEKSLFLHGKRECARIQALRVGEEE